MIISASRRTDIPSFYFDWFLNRIRDGYVFARNPMNPRQVGRVPLKPNVVDGIVLWTKNPSPMLNRIDEISPFPFYVQYTLNSYQTDVEPNLPSKDDVLIPVLQKLSDIIGAGRVVWRYDPILLSEKYTIDHHIDFFETTARRLRGYTEKCTISFVDYYRKTANRVRDLGLIDATAEDKDILAKSFSEIARGYGLAVDTCAEDINLDKYGISHARCIDDRIFEKVYGIKLDVGKDRSQRRECGCVSSIDIGLYNTCGHGCKYCYANYSPEIVLRNAQAHDACSPLLCGGICENDVVTDRKMHSQIYRG